MKARKIINGVADHQTPNNMISTSKYNLASFLPKNLFLQFSKVANLYFLVKIKILRNFVQKPKKLTLHLICISILANNSIFNLTKDMF